MFCPKSIHFSVKNCIDFLIDFWNNFSYIWVPFLVQIRLRNEHGAVARKVRTHELGDGALRALVHV